MRGYEYGASRSGKLFQKSSDLFHMRKIESRCRLVKQKDLRTRKSLRYPFIFLLLSGKLPAYGLPSSRNKVLIDAFLHHKFFMSSLLYDLTFINDYNLIGIPYGL